MTTTAKVSHTRGPWRQSRPGFLVLAGEPDPNGGYPHGRAVAKTTTDRSVAERLANARLIAAAPDLLEACRLVVRLYKGTTAHEQVPAWEAVVDAIVKATGESR